MLGLGVRGVGWREIEMLPNRAGATAGAPARSRLGARAALGLEEVTVSISHERHMAVAVAMADRPEGAPRGSEMPWR